MPADRVVFEQGAIAIGGKHAGTTLRGIARIFAINAGTYGPNELDLSFGPEVVFQKAPAKHNRSPRDGLQFFGHGRIDHRTRALTVALRDIDDNKLYEVELPAAEV